VSDDERDLDELSVEDLLAHVDTTPSGLGLEEVARRLVRMGPNAVRTHHARALLVLAHQVRSPILGLLAIVATVSGLLGEPADAGIVGAVLILSVGLGFVDEYRAERAGEALHRQLRSRARVRRDDEWTTCDVTGLVPGDVVALGPGDVIPADVALIESTGLECNESVLTGESDAVPKAGTPGAGVSRVCHMGTVVRSGTGVGVVVATGSATTFGHIAARLGERHEETGFQRGLRQLSTLLARVAGVLGTFALIANLVLDRPVTESLLYASAVAIGVTPQLLPAVVTTGLASGARRLARRRVLVKRLVSIEDLGDIELLLTDKTGTLTEGTITLEHARDVDGRRDGPDVDRLIASAAMCTLADGDAIDTALRAAVGDRLTGQVGGQVVARVPFDHVRRMASVLVVRDDDRTRRTLVVKGAPEAVLARCATVPDAVWPMVDDEFAVGGRVLVVARRDMPDVDTVTADDERDLEFMGLLVFRDRPRRDAAAAIARLGALGVSVKVITGDNPAVAQHVWHELGLGPTDVLLGDEVDTLDDADLAGRFATTSIFARVDPEQKARLVRLHRQAGTGVGYLGDGINDALALHAADVGISVDGAVDVARDAADVILLDKDLGVLADGVVEGRRTFSNTVKYVMMSTSSNLGNMVSAAVATAVLPFLPLLPAQILLANLLYDTSQLAVPTDRVDDEWLARPSHWDLRRIRRFMAVFGPLSSAFDLLMFGVLLWVLDASAPEFRSAWFVESLLTQSLVVLVIRTDRVPFLRSRPSRALAIALALVVVVAVVLPWSPLAGSLGFTRLPLEVPLLIVAMVVVYLSLVELTKAVLGTWLDLGGRAPSRRPHHRVHRRAARFSHADRR
jgi:Mg2+-importing ATPase